MAGEPVRIEYVEARRVLLDVLGALQQHLGAVVLVGAQAVYLRTEGRIPGYQPFTTDADVVLDPTLLGSIPPLGDAMRGAGFVLTDEPGIWEAHVTRPGFDDEIVVPVDLIVPEELAPKAGRRAARLPGGHGKTAARKSPGLAGAVVDNSPIELAALEPADQVYQRLADTTPKYAARYQGYAETSLRLAVSQASAMAQSRYRKQLAAYVLKTGKASEAATQARAVLGQNLLDAEAHRLLGEALLYQGDLQAAQASLEAAIALNANSADTLVALGHVAREDGRDAMAVDYYQRAYQRDPFNVKAADAFRNMVNELGLTAKTPTAVWNLSEDERDYLVRTLSLTVRMLEESNDMLRQLISVYPEGGLSSSVEGAEAVRRIAPLVSKAYDQHEEYYRLMRKQSPPPKLAVLHYNLNLAAYNKLEFMAYLSEHLPRIHSVAEYDRAMAEYDEIITRMKATTAQLASDEAALSHAVSKPVFESVVAEAGFAKVPQLKLEEISLMTALSQRVKPPETSDDKTGEGNGETAASP